MRIHAHKDKPLSEVFLALSDAEAAELRDALEDLLTTKEAGWHVHVSDADYRLSVTVYREDDPDMVF
jgi:hypothetical protein